MNKKTVIAMVLGVAVLILANLEVTKSPVRAVLTVTDTDTDQLNEASNQHVEFTINIRLRLRLPSFGAGLDQ